jgi:hypothetical protein
LLIGLLVLWAQDHKTDLVAISANQMLEICLVSSFSFMIGKVIDYPFFV